MTTIALALALLAAGGQPEAAPQWVALLETANGGSTYYDPASIRRGGELVRVRLRALPGSDSQTGVREFLAEESIDCARRTTTTLSLSASMHDGSSIDVPQDGKADPINPNTPVAALFDVVCTARSIS